jgi:hypothetical protein
MADNPFPGDTAEFDTLPEDALGAFIDDVTEAQAAFDPARSITIRTSGGNSQVVPLPEGQETASVADALRRSGLAIGGSVEYWVNGTQVNADFQVGAGAAISVVGNVKGGDF